MGRTTWRWRGGCVARLHRRSLKATKVLPRSRRDSPTTLRVRWSSSRSCVCHTKDRKQIRFLEVLKKGSVETCPNIKQGKISNPRREHSTYIVVVISRTGCSKDGVSSLHERAKPFLHPPHFWEHLHQLWWAWVTKDTDRGMNGFGPTKARSTLILQLEHLMTGIKLSKKYVTSVVHV